MPEGYWCGISVDWCHYCYCYRNYTQMEAGVKRQWTAANAFTSPSSSFSPALSSFFPSIYPLILFTFQFQFLLLCSSASPTSILSLSTTFLHSPLKLRPLCRLHHGHDGVRDRSPNVGTHDDRNSRTHFQHCEMRPHRIVHFTWKLMILKTICMYH